MIGFSHHAQWTLIKALTHLEKRYIILHYTIDVTIVGIYAPNTNMIRFWDDVFSYLLYMRDTILMQQYQEISTYFSMLN